MLKTQEKHGKLLTVKNGYLVCPNCLRNKHLMKITPDATASHIVIFCRDCKREHIVDIEQGQCYESRSQ